MIHKVVFDTNSIRNAESVSDFLGGRSELERFSKVADIIIPDLVIDEIKRQKVKHLNSKRDSFLANPFHLLRKLDEEETKAFDVESWILELAGNEKIKFSIITLTRSSALEEIKKLCLDNHPPFEEKTDKGFKDAYIYLTILDFLESCKKEFVFFVTKDGRFEQAFKGNKRLRVVKDYNEFEKYIDSYFREKYFISRLKEEISADITATDITNIWLNGEENWVIEIATNDFDYYRVEVDFSTREIMDFTNHIFTDDINGLISSGSFAATHSRIAKISEYTKYFSDEEIQQITQAAIDNGQISSIITDEDVREFFNKLQNKLHVVPDEIRSQIHSMISDDPDI